MKAINSNIRSLRPPEFWRQGGEGAGKGAAIGALASGLKKGQAVSVPSGTLLEFHLQQPVTVNVAR